MPDFALDYGLLHEARRDLHDLAERIGPRLKGSPFAEVGDRRFTTYVSSGRFPEPRGRDDHDDVFGDAALAGAFSSFFHKAEGPMESATARLRELGDVFGSVADAVFDTDAQMADGLGVMGATMGLDRWKAERAAWDHRQAHAGECLPGPDGRLPSFCSAPDPGPPPTDQTITTTHGSVTTHLTLDDGHNVIREDTTVVNGDQRYTSTTTYTDGGASYTTETTWSDGSRTKDATTVGANGSTVTDSTGADGSVTHTVIELNETGGGTKTVTAPGGATSVFTRTGRTGPWHQQSGPGTAGGKGSPSHDRDRPPPRWGGYGP